MTSVAHGANAAGIVENNSRGAISAPSSGFWILTLVQIVVDGLNSKSLAVGADGASEARSGPTVDPGMRAAGVKDQDVKNVWCGGVDWGDGACRKGGG